MNPKLIFLGLVFVFIAFLSQQAFAYNPGCNDISIDSYTVRIEAGKSTIVGFAIRNSASERFFVDFANAFDSSPNFGTETNGYDRIILSQGTGTINVKITGKNYDSGIPESAFIELRGHFLNGNACELQETITKKFSVIVEKSFDGSVSAFVPLKASCANVFLSVPKNALIRNSFGAIQLEIKNNSDYRTTIRVSGENAFADPSLVSIPKQSELTETIEIRANASNAKLEFFVENAQCSFSRKTVISNILALDEIVSINAKTIDLNAEDYEAIVSLQNKSGQEIIGNIEFDLPAGWAVEGNKSIALEGFQAKTIKFKVIPDKPLAAQTVIGTIFFKSNGESVSAQVEFKPKTRLGIAETIAGTMLALLGNNVLGGTIIMLIIIIVALFLLAFYSRKQKSVVIINKPSEVKT